MADLNLSLGFNDYDHVRELFTGRIKPEGITLTGLEMHVEESFPRFIRYQEWDVSEISFGSAAAAIDRGDAPFVLIPVFPSRVFRLSAIYVRADGKIARPEDLKGKRIGMPQWSQTATIYVRGWLSDTVGIALGDIDWYQLGPSTPGRVDAAPVTPPACVRLTDLPGGSLIDRLLAGELDAVVSAGPPRLFRAGDPRLARLFPDYEAAERAYFRATGIFPIMHVTAIRRDRYEANRWIARNLFNAFERAKNASAARMQDLNVSHMALPWMPAQAMRAAAEFFPDGDYWPYGIAKNRLTLAAFLAFCHAQGVTRRRLEPEELFVSEAQEPARLLDV